jgi:cystathionine beta-lyase
MVPPCDFREAIDVGGFYDGLAERGYHYGGAFRSLRGVGREPAHPAVVYAALERHPGHASWQRDFTCASGLVSIGLKPLPAAATHAFINELTLFGIGVSWGGYESLAIPFDCAPMRSATTWAPGGPTVRFHIGLEDVDDLIEDLERGFAALAAAR